MFTLGKQIQPIRLQDIGHVIEIDQSESENFQSKKFAPKNSRSGNSVEYPAI